MCIEYDEDELETAVDDFVACHVALQIFRMEIQRLRGRVRLHEFGFIFT